LYKIAKGLYDLKKSHHSQEGTQTNLNNQPEKFLCLEYIFPCHKRIFPVLVYQHCTEDKYLIRTLGIEHPILSIADGDLIWIETKKQKTDVRLILTNVRSVLKFNV